MDDTNLVQKQTVSDDPELAKVLAGVNAAAQTNNDDEDTELQYEGLEQEASAMPDNNINEIEAEEIIAPNPAQSVSNFGGLNLDNIKISALQDLRPLVDKLNVSNEEKFDIYLLLLRSSDDNTLIQQEYEAARNIEDETKRANALLDVIKEIDYFNSKNIAA